ncbi:MAG TPA: outer membrane protein assembly factor BamB [Pseudomonadales bacterium]
MNNRAHRTVSLLYRSLVLVGLCGLVACSSNEKANTPAELVDFDATLKIEKLWSTGVGNGQGDVLSALVPAVSAGAVYAASVDGDVEAYDLASGDELWSMEVGSALSAGVAVSGDRLFVGTQAGEMVALRSSSGEFLWATELGSQVDSAPTADRERVYVQTVDGKVIALDAETGYRLWAYDGQQPVLTQRGTATPVLDGDTLYTGLDNGKVIALDARTGQMRWEGRVAVPQGRSEIDRMVDVDGSPLVAAARVYAVSLQGNLVAFNRSSGRLEWRFPASSYVALTEGFGNLYLVEGNGAIKALNPESVLQRWEQGALSWRGLTSAVPISGYLLVGDREGYIHVLSQVDGSFVARFELDSDGVNVAPVVSDDIALVYGNSGKLMAFRLAPKR